EKMACSASRLYEAMRYLLIVLCALIFISGFVLVGLGAWIIYGASTLVYALGPYSVQLNMSYICIGVGAVLILTSLAGSCGAWKENRCCLMLFFIILTAVFVAEVVGTIFVWVYRELVGLVVWRATKESLQKLYMGPAAADPISAAWNTIMIKFKCCGFENSTEDFTNSAFSQATGLSYPKTCCIEKTSPACDGLNLAPDVIQPQSCYKKVISVIRDKSAVLGAAAGTICVIELASIILTMLLFVKLGVMQREERDM
uniref:Tetraspanin n=2 Tax=Pygocentrus nattereri TaxID=42514 RepID=A0A3B4BPP3_PYGNA